MWKNFCKVSQKSTELHNTTTSWKCNLLSTYMYNVAIDQNKLVGPSSVPKSAKLQNLLKTAQKLKYTHLCHKFACWKVKNSAKIISFKYHQQIFFAKKNSTNIVTVSLKITITYTLHFFKLWHCSVLLEVQQGTKVAFSRNWVITFKDLIKLTEESSSDAATAPIWDVVYRTNH